MLPIVAIVGRPNVGKSTLFNRLIGRKYAIESKEAGTTRDRVCQPAKFRDFDVILVDTGGLDFGKSKNLEGDVEDQARIAIEEADLILFVTDARSDLLSSDYNLADLLRKSKKNCLLVANKCDFAMGPERAANLYQLGFGEPIQVSALQGFGIDEIFHLGSEILADLGIRPHDEVKTDDRYINISFLGRPNVGKSSLVNAFLGEKRVIVSKEPGTTRDSVDTAISYKDTDFNLIDTAGIRRRGKVGKGVEKYSVLRSLQSIARSDIALLIIDGSEGIVNQDCHVAEFVLEEGKGLIIVVNKSDLIENRDKVMAILRRKLIFLPWAPVVFVSALTLEHINKILDLAMEISKERKRQIEAEEFGNFIVKTALKHSSAGRKGLKPKIYEAKQVDINPPCFKFVVNRKDAFHFSYRRYLENQIREKYGFNGTAVKLMFVGR